ncbi:MAG TPA: S8 family serine peptidase [Blastocatellia bacterium]|nr:S8 family serine peptidase [Blastocatellia bacterium]
MIKMIHRVLVTMFLLGVVSFAASAATLGPALSVKLSGLPGTADAGIVVVVFNTTVGLTPSHLDLLRNIGITKGITYPHLGMVGTPATAGQVRALAANPAVRSVWSNDRLAYYNNETRMLCGVDKVRTDAAFTKANGGLPVSGAGDFSIVINDSGIDATHPDLHFPEHVVQNLQILTDTETLSGFTPVLTIENLPDTDLNVGHGTHCAGIVGGNGAASGALYAGVAPGAKLIGAGSGAVLFILNALGGFEWSISNQAVYNIRVISNSWGSNGRFDPDNPINIASKTSHDLNMVIVFAAGNSGPGKDTLNPYAAAPWVIGVAAGTKEGGLAGFSSRGIPRADRLSNGDPTDDFTAPAITAPGTGREFASDQGKFTSDVVSVRSKTNVFANGLDADAEIPVAFVPFYTQISGTSMATPFIAGTVGLMLDADPTLTPDQVKQILQQTASQMAGFSEFEVGAGYVNVYAALDKVFNRSKNYGTYSGAVDVRQFNAQFNISKPTSADFPQNPKPFHIDYNPAALPGPGSSNSTTFIVQPGISVLDVFANIDNALMTGDGNTIGLLLTDPTGARFSSGVLLPILDAPNRQVVVKNPVPGQWLLEARGVRGLAAVPNFSLPTSGAATPGPIDGTITQQQFTLATIPDIQGHPAQAQIESVIKNRMMDTFPDGTFRPDSNVTRRDFAQTLVLNTPLRQSLGATRRFTDVTGSLEAIAEAVTANGSTLRDWNFTPQGMMGASGPSFNPSGLISRLNTAVALVRALGLDAQARALAGTNVRVSFNGETFVLADNADIPAALRGYVQIALDKQILQAFFALEQGPFDFQPTLKARVKPNDPTTRAFLSFGLDHFRQHFASGD